MSIHKIEILQKIFKKKRFKFVIVIFNTLFVNLIKQFDSGFLNCLTVKLKHFTLSSF